MTFSTDELARYQRQLGLAGFGPAAQERLKEGSVLVIGAGGLGCPALLYLAAAGVGRIVLLDADRVEVSNLQRQNLFTAADAGRLKVEAAAERLRALNPLIVIEPHAVRFARDNALALVRSVDVVLDGSDNFSTRYLANDACVLADRPLVYGAIHGFEGQVSVFNWRSGPTYRCLFPDPPEAGSVPNCAEAGVLGVLPGLIGTLQAAEVIKLMTGIGEPLSGRLLLWNLLQAQPQVIRFRPDPQRRVITTLPSDAAAAATCTAPTMADEIDPAEVPPEAILLDLREQWERALGAIERSGHLPLSELRSGAQPAGLDRERLTVLYCASGARSRQALGLFRERFGFANVLSLRGGFHAWQRAQPV